MAAGCAHVLTPALPAHEIAERGGFTKTIIQASPFNLTAFYRIRQPGHPLVVYIEGDGRAWKTRTRLSDDPTPRQSLVLSLSASDPSANVAYLARPCQYSGREDKACHSAYWSNKRFSETVIKSMNKAVSFLTNKANAPSVELIGYSGGGGVAVLLAARRSDVSGIRTLAGNLNHILLSQHHRIGVLDGSLNPADYAQQINNIPQHHYVGKKDRTIPPLIAKSYIDRSTNDRCIQVDILENVSHRSGWLERWEKLRSKPLKCT